MEFDIEVLEKNRATLITDLSGIVRLLAEIDFGDITSPSQDINIMPKMLSISQKMYMATIKSLIYVVKDDPYALSLIRQNIDGLHLHLCEFLKLEEQSAKIDKMR